MKKKKLFNRKLALIKETIADLNREEMNNNRAGAQPSDNVTSCFTEVCCATTNTNTRMGNTSQHGICETRSPFCVSLFVIC